MKPATIINQRIDQLQQWLDQQTPRDRLALIILTVFLVVFGTGYSIWKLHSMADTAQLRATEQRELLLWMRSQAPNIRQSQGEQMPLNMIIQTTAQNQGLTVSQMPAGEQVQVVVTHQSFAVLGSWLSRVAEQGVSIQQLDISQSASGELQLKALMSLTAG
ncbi:type II secretion system protein GspM [Alkanindiges sp. WGS2144]|uniref:type II secretion system protein GspM n=1 Tax=Alkanindiges sp. WGS2144 TaxID=3366808 RepID=UPI00375246CA